MSSSDEAKAFRADGSPGRARRFSTSLRRLVASSLLLPGCAATDAPPDAGRVDRGRDAVAALVSNDDGLEVLQWAIAADDAHVAATLSGYADGAAAGERDPAWFRRNGLALERIRLADVVPLRDALGATALNLTAWHGQVPQWREMIKRRLGPGTTAIAVNGRVSRYAPGAVRLMARSWSVPMETGPYLLLELVPVHARPSPTGIGRLLADDGTPLTAAVELSLEPGHAYVLTAAPREDDATGDGDADQDTPPGPPVPTPPTIGELLFEGTGNPPAQGFMVFLPRLAADPLDPPLATAARNDRAP